MPRKNSAVPDFEKSLAELQALVEKLEHGEYSLDDALKHFERGIGLVRHCQHALRDAEQRVQILLADNGDEHLEPFESPEADADPGTQPR